jgi:hypothetical protein
MEKIEKLKVIRDKISQNLLRSESENKHLEKDGCMWDSMSVDAITSSHVGFQISTKNTNLVEDHPMNISCKFVEICSAVSDKKI